MSTVFYGCGCSFSYSMFGEREMMGHNICTFHMHSPEVQDAKISELHGVIKKLLDRDGLPDNIILGVE